MQIFHNMVFSLSGGDKPGAPPLLIDALCLSRLLPLHTLKYFKIIVPRNDVGVGYRTQKTSNEERLP